MHAVRGYRQPLPRLHAVAAQVQAPRGQAHDGGRGREQPQALLQARIQVRQATCAWRGFLSYLWFSSRSGMRPSGTHPGTAGYMCMERVPLLPMVFKSFRHASLCGRLHAPTEALQQPAYSIHIHIMRVQVWQVACA